MAQSRLFQNVSSRLAALAMLAVTALAFLLLGAPVSAQEDMTTASTLQPAGPVAQMQLDLFMFLVWIGAGIFVVVVSLLLYAVFRFRSRDGGKAIPKQVEGSTSLEIAWTIVPILIVIAIAVPTVRDIFVLAQVPEDRGDVLKIEAIGHQWWWEFRYPELGITTANELYIPTNTVLDITLDSDDVIHSFWVPQLGGKMDTNPGKPNRMWLEAEKPGVYLGQCAEFCGVNHSMMRFRVIAVSPEEFDEWVASREAAVLAMQEPVPPLEELEGEAYAIAKGREIFAENGCADCHVIAGLYDGYGFTLAPPLTQLGERRTIAAGTLANTRENLAAWIRNTADFKPDTIMNPFGEDEISDEELDYLITFLHSLK